MPNNTQVYLDTATLTTIILISSIVALAGFIFAIIIYWQIFAKAGYSGALGLLMFVPIANIVMLCVLAFSEWPIYRELNYWRQMAARGQQYQPLPQQFPPPQQFSSSPQYPPYGPPPQYPQM